MSPPCPLCLAADHHTTATGADDRTYYLCAQCALIFTDPRHLLPPEAEKRHYATHENHINNAGYVSFLNQVLAPVLPNLNHTMRGLDYGCGPGPVLAQLLKRHGIHCDNYDPLFANIPLRSPYDFIFATECLEHFYHPGQEIQRICALLKPGGLLGIMTERWTSLEQFQTWYYTKDPTHVCFYHARTFDYLCEQYGWVRRWQDNKRVIILQRQSAH